MRLIVIRDIIEKGRPAEADMLRHVLSMQPLATLATEAVRRISHDADDAPFPSGRAISMDSGGVVWAIPRPWDVPSHLRTEPIIHTEAAVPIDRETWKKIGRDPWLTVSDGRFATMVHEPLLGRVLAGAGADVIAVEVTPELQACRERIRLTERGELVGCRRLYRDVAEPAPVPVHWPHHVFIKTSVAEMLLGETLPPDFRRLVEKCRDLDLKIRSFAVAGTRVDLASSQGLLSLSGSILSEAPLSKALSGLLADRCLGGCSRRRIEISPQARLIGPVLVGDDVRIAAGAVVIGPAVLCDHSVVEPQALVDTSIVGQTVTVERGSRLTDVCVMAPCHATAPNNGIATVLAGHRTPSLRRRTVFRTWPRFSYAGGFKRLADIAAAAIVLILFAPIIPILALAIKINSPGPVFYKDRRQGLHGRPFRCIKFRTMKVGAAAIQDKLRFVSEVDGPQFKMNDDPRISSVGHFLRETCIDEIPQFFNVLWGQMSVVGPRPSPEAENTQCPSWRDARLSVRPGITGLWQICRTRQPFKDFQEWIHYDTKYVRELSLRGDLWICWRTFKRLLNTFADQF